jgi:hypothetical protein
VSFETIFDSKQPKLEPKLVSALSETKRLFRLIRFYTETESFDVSIEPKQTEDQPNKKERKEEHLFCSASSCTFPLLKTHLIPYNTKDTLEFFGASMVNQFFYIIVIALEVVQYPK